MADTRVVLTRLSRVRSNLDPDVPIYALSRGVVRVLRAHAPVRTGNLKAGIGIVGGRRGKSTVIGVSLAATGRRPTKVRGRVRPFDYVDITRFGHKVATQDRIYPKQLRADASVVSTGLKRRSGRTGALAVSFSPGGGTHFFGSVKRYHPKSDWVADAGPEIEVELARVALNYKRKLESS